MVVAGIITQPAPSPYADTLCSAYRNTYFKVYTDSPADATLPVYADIYVGSIAGVGTYYKTISSYSIQGLSGVLSGDGMYQFDIQDALQEYIQTYFPELPITDITSAESTDAESMIWVYVCFRGSAYVGDVLVPEAPIPVQATATTPAVAGGGLQSNSFMVTNSSIIPYYANDILFNVPEYVLSQKRLNPLFAPNTRIYSLSNFPISPRDGVVASAPDPTVTLPQYRGDYGGFPIQIIKWQPDLLLDDYYRNCDVRLIVGNETGTFGLYPITTSAYIGPGVYYVPFGMKEIEGVIGSSAMDTILNSPYKWYGQVAILDLDKGDYAWFSPWFQFMNKVIEETRIAFQNAWGVFEWVSFARSVEGHKSSSSEQYNPIFQNFSSTDARTLGHKRTSIKANDEFELTATFSEVQMQWIKELIDSPQILIENKDGSLFINERTLLPAKITDSSIVSKKSVKDGRVNYVLTIKLTPAWDYITLRN